MSRHYPFLPEPLPYEYTALEPYVDEKTLYYHHDKHYVTYINNLNAALEKFPEYHSWTLEELLMKLQELPADLKTPVQRNGGGVYNHELYFNCMAPRSEASPCMENWIAEQFVSIDKWKERIKQAGLSVFGSGYVVFTVDKEKQLQIMTVANQDTPLSLGVKPIMLIDVWEHAYYLKYQNRRPDYIDNWFSVANWDYIEKLYTNAI